MRGKDGIWYDNPTDAWAADKAWDIQRKEQEKQKELLEEQNRLLAEQNKINAEMEALKIQSEQEMQIIQIQHEENMRILKLCDKVGINKEYIDNFKEYLFGKKKRRFEDTEDEIAIKNAKEGIDEATEYLTELDWIIKNENPDIFPEMDTFEKQLSEKQIKTIRDKYEKWCNNSDKYENELINIGGAYIVLSNREEKKSSNTTKYLITFLISTLISLIITLSTKPMSFLWYLMIVATFILGIYLIRYIFLLFKEKEKKEKDRAVYDMAVDNAFKELLYIETMKINDLSIKGTLEYYIQSLNQIIEDCTNNIEYNQKDLSSKWKDFIKFRKNHYNSAIEKLLIDVGLKDDIINSGLEYPKINVNNKKNDGSVEDYIAYFDDLEK